MKDLLYSIANCVCVLQHVCVCGRAVLQLLSVPPHRDLTGI